MTRLRDLLMTPLFWLYIWLDRDGGCWTPYDGGMMSDPQQGEASHIDLAIDRNGERYTTHCFADWGDPWLGATILLPGTVNSLRNQGLLPLMIVWPPEQAGGDDD